MSADGMPPTLPDGTVPEIAALGVNALLRAIRVCAEDGAAATQKDARETKELAAAALAFAQTLVVLDPTRLQGGDTPDARRASVPTPPQPGVRDGDRDGRIGER